MTNEPDDAAPPFARASTLAPVPRTTGELQAGEPPAAPDLRTLAYRTAWYDS